MKQQWAPWEATFLEHIALHVQLEGRAPLWQPLKQQPWAAVRTLAEQAFCASFSHRDTPTPELACILMPGCAACRRTMAAFCAGVWPESAYSDALTVLGAGPDPPPPVPQVCACAGHPLLWHARAVLVDHPMLHACRPVNADISGCRKGMSSGDELAVRHPWC